MITRLLLAWVLVAAPAPQPPPAGADLALWHLHPLGLEPATAARLEQLLRAELARLPGRSLLDEHQAEQLLAKPGLEYLRKCTGATTCLCSVARTLRVRQLVTGVIGALGQDYTLDLKLIDAASCREIRRINEALSGREDLLIGAMRSALFKLVAPQLHVGALLVEVATSGAEVLVDGRLVGTTPLAGPITGLRPGGHRLTIRKVGASTFEEVVPVRFQQTTRVKVDMVRSTLVGISYEDQQHRTVQATQVAAGGPGPARGPGWRIAGWALLGVAGAAAVAGGLCGWRVNVLEEQLAQAAQDGALGPQHQDIIDRGHRWSLGANLSWGVAAGAAVLGSLLLVVDTLAGGRPAAALSAALPGTGPGAVVSFEF